MQQRGHAINGEDPYFPWFSLGNDTGLEGIDIEEVLDAADLPKIIDGDTMSYVYIDTNVTDGLEYTYSVVAYDMGVEPPYTTTYKDIGNGTFEAVVDTNYSNPDKWADPDGYASIENSKGTTILDRNFVQVYPGVMPANDVSNIGIKKSYSASDKLVVKLILFAAELMV